MREGSGAVARHDAYSIELAMHAWSSFCARLDRCLEYEHGIGNDAVAARDHKSSLIRRAALWRVAIGK